MHDYFFLHHFFFQYFSYLSSVSFCCFTINFNLIPNKIVILLILIHFHCSILLYLLSIHPTSHALHFQNLNLIFPHFHYFILPIIHHYFPHLINPNHPLFHHQMIDLLRQFRLNFLPCWITRCLNLIL
jgi:hypothetical protein